MTEKPKIDKIRILTMVIAAFTAVAITFFTIKYGEGAKILIVVPLYVSICVLFLQSGVNRWAFLIGAINSLFYAAVYIYDGLYLSAFSAAFFSFPFQVWTFFRWKKKDDSGKTVFHRLSGKIRALIAVGYAVLFVAFYELLQYIGSDWGLYDCNGMLLGILVTILCTVPYVEYSPLQCLNVLINLIMFAKMAMRDPIQYTYLTYEIYCFFCVTQAFIRIMKIYRKQRLSENNINTEKTAVIGNN